MTLPRPQHFDPKTVAELRVERAALLADAAEAWRIRHQIRPAAGDRPRIAAFGIDVQIGFCHPDGGLFVPGAVEDTARALDWLYAHLDRITATVWSLDTHELYQIFHPGFWRDPSGARPAPFTPIRAADVAERRWIPRGEPAACLEYCRRLEAQGRYVLTVWPYHGLLGGLSNALLPAAAELMLFHGLVRDSAPRLVVKGRLPLTEMYSVFSPEVPGPGAGFDEALLDHLRGFDRIYVFGQASSHCVLATLEDLAERDLALLSRVVLLEDATSPVPPPPLDPLPPDLDFPAVAKRRIRALADRGLGLALTTDPVA